MRLKPQRIMGRSSKRGRGVCSAVRACFVLLGAVACTNGAGQAYGDDEPGQENVAEQAGVIAIEMIQELRSRSVNGGYAGRYRPDSTGEELTTIRIQHPGTPNVGQCFLRADKIFDDQDFLSAATEVGRVLAWHQGSTGGWPIEVERAVAPPTSDLGMAQVRRQFGKGALDDNATQGSLRFLMDLDERIDAPWLNEAIELGLSFMLESQLEAGGWPQYYPLIGGYHNFYTFNDGATNNAIEVMLKAHEHFGDSRFLESARQGAEFILASQLPPEQPGWAQQYDWDLKPAPARTFEPAAVSSSSTSRNILTLLDIAEHTGDLRYLEPIPAAIDWLEMSALDEDHWARFYELETNRPIYPSRSGEIVDSLEKLPEAERGKYAYVAGFKAKEAINLYRLLTESDDVNNFEIWRDKVSYTKTQRKISKSSQNILEIISANNGEYDKSSKEVILGEFVSQCETILDYLEYH